jgi:hypothetical protein
MLQRAPFVWSLEDSSSSSSDRVDQRLKSMGVHAIPKVSPNDLPLTALVKSNTPQWALDALLPVPSQSSLMSATKQFRDSLNQLFAASSLTSELTSSLSLPSQALLLWQGDQTDSKQRQSDLSLTSNHIHTNLLKQLVSVFHSDCQTIESVALPSVSSLSTRDTISQMVRRCAQSIQAGLPRVYVKNLTNPDATEVLMAQVLSAAKSTSSSSSLSTHLLSTLTSRSFVDLLRQSRIAQASRALSCLRFFSTLITSSADLTADLLLLDCGFLNALTWARALRAGALTPYTAPISFDDSSPSSTEEVNLWHQAFCEAIKILVSAVNGANPSDALIKEVCGL